MLHPWDANLMALALGVSLFLFVLWNVTTTFLISRKNIEIAKALPSSEVAGEQLKNVEAAQKRIQKWSLKYYATWYVVFMISALSGFLAGLLLIALLAIKLLRVDFSYYSLFH